MSKYSTADIAEILGVSTRTIQRHLATLRDMMSPEHNTYDYEVVKLLSVFFNYDLNDTKRQPDDSEEYDRIEYFTEAEYQEFHKRLVEYPLLIERITTLLDEMDYHKKDLEWHKNQQTKLIDSIKERNFIEAKEKRFDQ